MNRFRSITLTALALTLATPMALSQTAGSENQIRPYVGADLGYYRLDNEEFLDQDEDLRDNRTAGRFYAGLEANRVLGLQLGYIDFGETEDGNAKMDVDGTTVSGILALPVSETFKPVLKLGNLSWDRERSYSQNLRFLSDSDSGNDPFYGAGARFQLSNHVDLQLLYERFAIDDTDLDMASAGLKLNF